MHRCLLLLPFLAGCPAEMLGIPVSARGIDAVSMEDLRRDTRKLSDPDTDRRAHLRERYEQMGLTVDPTGLCGERGAGPLHVLITAPDGDPKAVEQQAPVAVAISLAKSVHGHRLTDRRLRVCVGAATGAAHTLSLGPLGSAEPVLEPSTSDLHVQASGELTDPDYRTLEALTRELVPTLESWLLEPLEGV